MEDIHQDYSRLTADFSTASQLHERNAFTEAATQYFRIATEALNLVSKIHGRATLHPQRRLFLVTVGLALLLFIINLTLTLYFNL